MKKLMMIALIAAALLTQRADAQDPSTTGKRKDCGELREEIAAKLDAKGVRHYRLEVVSPDALGEAKQVGSCDGGTRRIAYQRLPVASAETVAMSTAAPQR